MAVFGGPQDVGHKFEIAVIAVSAAEHSRLQEYWEKAMAREHDWHALRMPPTVCAPVVRTVNKVGH